MTPRTATWIKKIKKFHKWPGIVIAFFAILFALSGIVLNHRNLISSVDIPRSAMPPGYQYNNWNLAAVRSSLVIGNDSVLLYGNIGIWLATGEPTRFSDYNKGFPIGIDKRKIYSVVKFKNSWVAGTHFGWFVNRINPNRWDEFVMPQGEERISDVTVKGDSLLILTRNFLYCTTDLIHLKRLNLPPPVGYQKKAGLFLTLWELHSGELFGLTGQLFVDLLGMVLLFLSFTGLLHFFFPKWISYLKKQKRSFAVPVAFKKYNLKWHNLIGYIFAIFLVINTTAGIFLRPPLLIPISSAQIGILPFTRLDNDNPWQDKLRRICWDDGLKRYLIYTSDGFYFADRELSFDLIPIVSQPLVSVMGCNVLLPLGLNKYIVGSFSGLFVWNPVTGEVIDFFTGRAASKSHGMGRPIGDHMVAGYLTGTNGSSYWSDYNGGILPINGGTKFPEMDANVLKESPISLWNAALEIHTGRIFEHLMGPFYLLYVPLMGIVILIVLISGFLVWWKGYRGRGVGVNRNVKVNNDPDKSGLKNSILD